MSTRPTLTRRHAITGAGAAGLVALSPMPSMPASGSIPALFAEWQAAYPPYLAALNEYGRAQEAWFPDRDNPEKADAERRAEAAKDVIEDVVFDLECQIFEAPALTLADIRCKLLVRSKTIGMGDGNVEDAGGHDQELLLWLLVDVERLAGKAVVS
jgi:hypothetical protein